MRQFIYSDIVLYFAFYSILGWLCEVVYCSIKEKRIVNRGLLNGPYCSIYGFGALIILSFRSFKDYNILMFLIIIVSTSFLEYFASFILEKILGLRLWDYTDKKFNINGRVYILNSILFGLMGILVIYVIHPFFSPLIDGISKNTEYFLGFLFSIVYILDFIITLNNLADLKSYLIKLKFEIQGLKTHSKNYLWDAKGDLNDNIKKLNKKLIKNGNKPIPDGIINNLNNLFKKGVSYKRLMNAFPSMTHKDYEFSIYGLEDYWEDERKTFNKRKALLKEKLNKLKNSLLVDSVKNKEASSTDKTIEGEISFAKGVNFYKLCWVFMIASVLGYFIETFFCIITRGHIESRQGMVFGPFSQIYGFGADIMVLALHPLQKYKDWLIFLGSALIGGTYEWICSFIQEFVFKSTSWDYSGQSLSLGGRTSLTYMIFWGILGLFFIRMVYPPLSKLIERIPNRQGYFLTWIIIGLLIADMAFSGIAVYRWAQRDAGIPPQGVISKWVDEYFPDSFMKNVYPNMNIKAAQN